ncbi:MAG: uridine kinase [Rhodothermia bacterium]|nr:MAG: uridine kinase [Rhodothermia bacterium]
MPYVSISMHYPVVIGIAGGSGSGKSTVLSTLVDELGSDIVGVLDHDAYYRDLNHIALEERAFFNFDHPDTLETDLLLDHLDELKMGRSIEKPVYDFTNHTRTDETTEITPLPIIIVEGLLVLSEPRLVDRMDIKVFVDADSDIRLSRRIKRDTLERGRSLESILEQYERTVRPMHLKFVEPSKREADIIIPRGGHNRVAIDLVLARIRMLVKESYAEESHAENLF